jgi:2-polyprenyl-6-hydroxyphenyl methylase / 3-demethylubiquinone-9 3-methyltransferase
MQINNAFYNDLGDRWEMGRDHPVALLRAENRLRNPWIAAHLSPASLVLDMGCGAGFLSHALAKTGHHVTGIDLSEQSLEVARRLDTTGRVKYQVADATATSFPSESFDVVCAMDLLEHVENPAALVREASRLLKPGGLFFFHTFNRTLLSYLIVIKGVEWCVKNTPPRMHIYRLFIKPTEMEKMCNHEQMPVQEIRGVNVKMSKPFWRMVWKREVPDDLEFAFSNSLKVGYSGIARKKSL